MAIMSLRHIKKCKVTPAYLQSIPDILLQNKRIEETCIISINPNEIIRAMSFGDVYAIDEKGNETLLNPRNYNSIENGIVEDASLKDPGGTTVPDSDGEQYTDEEIRTAINGVLYNK